MTSGKHELMEEPMGLDGGGALVSVSGRLLVREGPKALSWVVTRLAGQKILVVGPPGSGKTSFIEFLRWGVHVREDANVPTTMQTETAHRVFRVKVGETSQLEFGVSSIIDTAGHDGPTSAVDEIVRLKPNMIFLILSAADPLEAASIGGFSIEGWLDIFCERLSGKDPRTVSAMLKRSFVLVNKTDVRASSTTRKTKSAIKPIFRRWLTNGSVNIAVQKLPILTCSLLEGSEHERSANNVIEEIAKAMSRNGRKPA